MEIDLDQLYPLIKLGVVIIAIVTVLLIFFELVVFRPWRITRTEMQQQQQFRGVVPPKAEEEEVGARRESQGREKKGSVESSC
jgi:hypothetical protein